MSNTCMAGRKENNERAYVPDRYDKTQRLVGDPDCKLGVKRSTNQEQPDGSRHPKEKNCSGAMALASPLPPPLTTAMSCSPNTPSTRNEGDVTYFRPLSRQAVSALNQYPTHLAADAAYDAWYVYEAAIRHGGIAAVPLNQHRKMPFARLADGTPRCPIGLPMHPTKQFNHTYGYRAQRFQCPLLFPEATGATCEHEQFVKGKGCVKDVNWERGGIQRVTLDRDGPLYHAVYVQRTSCERINSQAKELGIEHPKVHNGRSVANLNTLIYVIINGRALLRAKSINRRLLQMN